MKIPEQRQPTLLPLEPLQNIEFSSNSTTSCGDCVSACCTENVVMPLTPSEALFMIESGTDLDWIEVNDYRFSRQERRDKVALYKLLSKCGNLEQPEDGGPGICNVFDSPERPKICSDFKVGSYCCKIIRDSKEVDKPSSVGVA